MESDDEFDMLPVKRRGVPVAKVPNGLDTALDSNFMKVPVDVDSNISGLNGIEDDGDLLPVKRRSAPSSNIDLADDPFNIHQKPKFPESNNTNINDSNVDIFSKNNGSNGLFSNHSQNGLSFSDLNEDNDPLPVKRRGVPAKVNNGASFVNHRGNGGGVLDSLGDDPFDNVSIQGSGTVIPPEITESGVVSKPVVSNGLSEVLQNEMLYNPLVNVFDRLGLKEESNNSKKEESINSDIYSISSVNYLSNNTVDTDQDNDFIACQDTALRKPKGVSFDLENDLNNANVNQDFPNKGDNMKQDLGNMDEMFQPIESSGFIDGLDFLEQCGGNDTDGMEELQRKSLYVRFDPLCGTQSDIKQPKLVNNDGNTNRNSKPVVVPDIKPVAEDQLFDKHPVTSSNDFIKENILPTEYNDPFSPVKQHVCSKADNDLKELFPTVRAELDNTGLVEPLLYTQSDMDEVIKKAKVDLDDDVYAREMDWKKKYEELESKIKEEVAMRELIEQDYRGKIDCLRKDNLDMKQVLSQYERTIVELTESTHRDNKSNEDTLAETIRAKEQLQEDLNSAEQTLFDTLKRVEKLKQAIDTYKQNEGMLKENNAELHTKLQKSEERYEKLREHVTKKIDDANLLISKERKQKEVDLAGLQAALKKAQNKANNLELEIQQKNIENQQLSQICDDLIKKVSGD